MPCSPAVVAKAGWSKKGGCLAGANVGAHQQMHAKGPFQLWSKECMSLSRPNFMLACLKSQETDATFFSVQVNLGPLVKTWLIWAKQN